ncbi:Proline porter II [Raoultella ornithinolytica]|nr:Proline porter II [Raoultella ornithinolytica]
MGICTTLIGVLPTYAQVGIFAPVLLVTLRIVQGLGAGAEISGAGTMLAEYAPKGKRGIIFVAGRNGDQLRHAERNGYLGDNVFPA